MRISVTAQARHGILWEARNKLGTARALAELLGTDQTTIGNILNLKRLPGQKWLRARWEAWEAKLSELFGHPIFMEDIFPEELRMALDAGFKSRVEMERDVDLSRLIQAGAHPALPPSPEEALFSGEMKERVGRVLKTLTPRQEQVLKMRFGLDGEDEHTLAQVAESLGVGSERIRQIEAKALRSLRHPCRARKLKPYVEITSADCGETNAEGSR